LRGLHIGVREPGNLYRFTRGNLYAAGFAGVALGIARGVFGAFVELARDKAPRDAEGVLRDSRVIQALVGEREAKLLTSRSLLTNTLAEMSAELEKRGAFTNSRVATLRLTSTLAIQQARNVVTALYQAAAATRFSKKIPLSAASATCTPPVSNRRVGSWGDPAGAGATNCGVHILSDHRALGG